ncbi:DUF899 domain-containing protein [Streptomyces sp. CS227]|uniref:DUF899 domain-containing protein n=1 Tax=Streptomyces sp. CS227 TaxID=1982763 RepID=UPI00211AC687
MTRDPEELKMSRNPDPARPPVVDRSIFEEHLERLRVREKAHTRESDAIAAARRRLPMVEVAGDGPILGPDGPITLLDAFEARRQPIVYYFRRRARTHPATGHV